jgi:hypothetical protein
MDELIDRPLNYVNYDTGHLKSIESWIDSDPFRAIRTIPIQASTCPFAKKEPSLARSLFGRSLDHQILRFSIFIHIFIHQKSTLQSISINRWPAAVPKPCGPSPAAINQHDACPCLSSRPQPPWASVPPPRSTTTTTWLRWRMHPRRPRRPPPGGPRGARGVPAAAAAVARAGAGTPQRPPAAQRLLPIPITSCISPFK